MPPITTQTHTWKDIAGSRPDTAARREAYKRGRQEALDEIVAHNLAELRKLRAVTQVELAHELGIAQPSLSGIEHRTDVQLSTLRDYVEGLGGHLEVIAVFDDVRVPLSLVTEEVQASRPPVTGRGWRAQLSAST